MAGAQERELVAGPERGVGGWRPREGVGSWTGAEGVGGWRAERQAAEDSWWQESREGVGGWTGERRVGGRRAERQLVAGAQERSCGWTGERRTAERLAWIHGGAVNTRHRAERRGDKIGSSEEESQDV